MNNQYDYTTYGKDVEGLDFDNSQYYISKTSIDGERECERLDSIKDDSIHYRHFLGGSTFSNKSK